MRVSTTVFTFSTMILFCNKLTWTGDGMQVICIIAYVYTVELSQGNKYKLKYCVKSGVKSVRVIYTYIYIYETQIFIIKSRERLLCDEGLPIGFPKLSPL